MSGAARAGAALHDDQVFERPVVRGAYVLPGARDRRRAALDRELVEASRALVEVYSTLLDDHDLWTRLAAQEVSGLAATSDLVLLEVVEQPLRTVLGALGYEGEPSAAVWAERIQEPLRLLSSGPGTPEAGVLAAAAEHHLRELVIRLDLLTGGWDEQTGSGPADPGGRRSSLRRALRVARDVAVPAALIAFLSTAAGQSVAGDVGAALGAGGTDAVTAVTEVGLTAWLAMRRSPRAGSTRDLALGLGTLSRVLALIDPPPRDEAAVLPLRRAAMQLAADGARIEGPGWLGWAEAVLDVLADPDFETESMRALCRSAEHLTGAGSG